MEPWILFPEASVAGLTLESATLVLSDDLTVGDNLTTSGTDPTMQLNGTLDLTGTGVQMQLGTGLVLDNVSTSANTGLLLTARCNTYPWFTVHPWQHQSSK